MQTIEEEQEQNFFSRHRVKVVIGVVLLAFGVAYMLFGKQEPQKKKRSTVNIVSIVPPPPPSPPLPPKERPPEPETIEQPKFQAEEQPDENPQQDEAAEPAPSIGTGIQGDGPNAFGLTNRGSGKIGGSASKAARSKFGRYAGQVQSRVAEVLRSNRKTRSAAMSIQVRIWADSSGRVNRAALANSTGDTALDQVITQEILSGLQLTQPPPEDMPMPIVMRITAKRPN